MLDLCSIAFNKPALVEHQIRLFKKSLQDDYALTVIDNSSSPVAADQIRRVCLDSGTLYERVHTEDNMHPWALNLAADYLLARGADYFGFIDHDIYPRRQTTLIDKIDRCGFYGIGQRHSPTDRLYLWPGFMFLSREWLDRKHMHLNFDGIRGAQKKDDGDCGSMNWPLFADEDWSNLYSGEHGYLPLRAPDGVGLQSWGYEVLGGDWIHLTNGSFWMQVPQPDERERLSLELLASL